MMKKNVNTEEWSSHRRQGKSITLVKKHCFSDVRDDVKVYSSHRWRYRYLIIYWKMEIFKKLRCDGCFICLEN